jgi:Protein of unknown function (DUF3102)
VQKPSNVCSPRPQGQLVELAERIRTEHQAVVGAVRTGLQHAMAAGELLLEAKQQVSHGQWGEWVSRHCEINERVAQMYMRVAEKWGEIESKAKPVSDLTLKAALKLISGPPKSDGAPPLASPPVKVADNKPKKAATHTELIEPWGRLPPEGRRRFLDAIGLKAILEHIPEAWKGRIQQKLEEPHQVQTSSWQPCVTVQ